MFLTNYDIFIRQAIPIHWRDTWKHHLIYSLCSPLKQLFEQVEQMERDTNFLINENSQVLSLEAKLNELNGYGNREINVEDGATNGVIRVVVPNDTSVINICRAHLKKVQVAGKNIEFVTYTL